MGREAIVLLLGLDHPIEKKIKWANIIFNKYGQQLQDNNLIKESLKKYKKKINNTWLIMKEIGVCDICMRCATLDGGSCCGDGIEDKFDGILLLINLLLGCKLPSYREVKHGCWFLGKTGCKLIARQVICVNYLCKKIYKEIELDKIHKLQAAILEETEQLFLIEEKIKAELIKLGV